MSLEALYFVAQIIAALAVVASLVFVGLQVRASTREQALTRSIEAGDNYDRFQYLIIENPEFREVWVKGADDIGALSKTELMAFGAYMALWVGSVMRFSMRDQAGYASPSTWEEVKAMYRPITARKGARQWWQKARGGYNERIRVLIDEIFDETKEPAGVA